jgi:hypothetical protein
MLIMPSTFQLLKSIEERTGSRFSLPQFIIFSAYLHAEFFGCIWNDLRTKFIINLRCTA